MNNDDDPLAPARGILAGLVLSMVLWLVAAGVVWLAW